MNELEEFKTSEKLEEFNKAFNKFQAMHLSIKKDAQNPHFRSSYASLPQVIETCREALTANGFSILQLPLGGIDVSRLLNRITHNSSQFVQWIFTTPIAKKDPQGIGSAITYSRRYNLTSSLGLPESDDDGHEASVIKVPEENKNYNEQQPPPPKKTYRDSDASVAPWTMNDNQRKRMFAITKAAGYEPSDVETFIRYEWKLDSTKKLNAKQYQLLCGDDRNGIQGLIPTRKLKVNFEVPPIPENDSSYGDVPEVPF